MRVLIIDDHALFRVGMRQTLDAEGDFDVVAEADDSRSAIDAASAHTPDIVLLDLSLPAPGGIETTQRVNDDPTQCPAWGRPSVRWSSWPTQITMPAAPDTPTFHSVCAEPAGNGAC